jgi:PAS domain S-box-containing protein
LKQEPSEQSRELFRLVVENVEDFAVFATDLEGRILSWNPGVARLLGYAEGEWVGRHASIIFTDELGKTEQAACGSEMRAALTEGRAEDRRWHRRKDGSRVWCNGLLMLLLGEDGEPAGFAKILRDETARKQAEDALRSSEERLRLVMESVADYAIFTQTVGGQIETWNAGAERTFGYTEGEAVGLDVGILFTPEDRERGAHEEEMRRARKDGRAEDERWHVSKRGVRFYASGVLTPLRSGGELIGYVKVARDLTERRRAEEELRRAHDGLERRVEGRTAELQGLAGTLLDEVKDRRAAEEQVKGLLHRIIETQEIERRRIARDLHDDLGQLLTALRLSISALGDGSAPPAEAQERLARTQEIARRVESTVDFIAWELRPAALDQLGLAAAAENFTREWSKHYGVPAKFSAVGLDGLRLRPEAETNLYRILQEALNNLHKHAGASRAEVLLERVDGKVVLIVEDDGKGFEPGRAVDGERGMGLLSMSERAAQVGGTLEVESAPGAGTTIYARVPHAGPEERGDADGR